jgi:DMSO/TMAO reductase YedYZ molybdopterin-dependent catalytic subunit
MNRRMAIAQLGSALALATNEELRHNSAGLLPDAQRAARWLQLDGKVPLIQRTSRPPNLETPRRYFNEILTPNEAFFVRYHHSVIPEVSAESWRLQVLGGTKTPQLSLALAQLQARYEVIELPALCYCSGNRRGLFDPHVMGIQWGRGAMGNARWRGVRLKDVLESVGTAPAAVEVSFDGADSALLGGPDFQKSLPVWKALDPSVLIAFEMNGQPLPHWNGFPARLVVPGWTATYWIKHLTSIEVLAAPFTGFWTKSAYRVPNAFAPSVERFVSQETSTTTPITEIAVNSMITHPEVGQRLPRGVPYEIRGLAWDAGYQIETVEISVDGGSSWRQATLDESLGRYSLRAWRTRFTPANRGLMTILARATNRLGISQPKQLLRNPAGYHHNLIEPVEVSIV